MTIEPAPPATPSRKRFLYRLIDPVYVLIEGIYSVLIILTFTLAATATAAQFIWASALLDDLFWAAFGCAVAWGIIDGVMYVLNGIAERGQSRRLWRLVASAPDEAGGVALLAEELDDSLAVITDEAERAQVYRGLYARLKGRTPQEAGFKREDLAGGLGTFLVAVGAALPVVLPLLFFRSDPLLAVRVSNFVAFAMLFLMGYRWAKYVGGKPVRTGLYLTLLGVVMMIVAIPLGG